MIKDFDTMLSLAIEAEGLIMVLKERGDSAPEATAALLAEKVTMLQAMLLESGPEMPEPQPEKEPEKAPEKEPVQEPEKAPAPCSCAEASASTEKESVEEKLAHQRAADIFKAFTINDKFRFTRELFRGSEGEFRDTLETISGMSGFDEAEEYFYEDLCWDPDNDDVKAFMSIVKSHF